MDSKKELPIGFFDSGIGGISVLKEAINYLPNEKFIYYGDNGNAPYGTKPNEEIRELALRAADFIVKKGVKALVVACNTATSAVIKDLRQELSIPVIGMEPALKPAVEMKNDGKIIVMATPATLQLKKFKDLVELYGDKSEIIPLPCPGLVELIEIGDMESRQIISYLDNKIKPYKKFPIDVVVLGCTHYIFIKKLIGLAFNDGTKVIDGNHGTIKQLIRILEKNDLMNDKEIEYDDRIQIFTSGDERRIIPLCRRLITL